MQKPKTCRPATQPSTSDTAKASDRTTHQPKPPGSPRLSFRGPTKEKPTPGHGPLNPPGGAGFSALITKGTELPQFIVRMFKRPKSSVKQAITKKVNSQKIKLKVSFPARMPPFPHTVPEWR